MDALRTLGGKASRARLMDVAHRDGGFSDRELTTPAPGKSRGKYESRVAYELSWALSHLKREGYVENPARAQWQIAVRPAPRPSVAPPGLLVTAMSTAPPPRTKLIARLRALR